MKKCKKKFTGFVLTIISLFVTLNSNTIQGQDFGADLVSSYVWRGTQFGSGAHIQPWMELGSGSLTGGVWGSFPTTSSGGGNELDLWVSYDFGPLALTITNYSFPTNDGTYGNGNPGLFDNDWMEVSGSANLGPIGLTIGYFTHAEALYLEAVFPIGAIDIGIGFGSDSKDAFYAGGNSGIVNLSFGGSKDIKITEDYSLPVSGSFIYNPDSEAAFLLFGISF
jgi:hypothetical protein|tara:strand:+ start:2423 stop:3091 length:669 start_codon:yes stop_codon:yes gene_type:complete